MDYYFSGVSSARELQYLLAAGIRRILVDPVQYRRVIEPSLGLLPSDMLLALDSGAYRAFRQGRDSLIPLSDYVAIAASFPFNFVVCPDMIGDWERSYYQWKAVAEIWPDCTLLPVWQWGAPPDMLAEMLAASPVVGIGGCQPWLHVSSKGRSPQAVKEDKVQRAGNLKLLEVLCNDNPGRFHLFGLCWEGAINALKDTLASGNSSHYLCGARKAQVVFAHSRSHWLSSAPARCLSVAKGWNRELRCMNNARVIAHFLREPCYPPLAVC